MPKKRTKKTSGRARHARKPVCFVIMPFGGWPDDYYLTIYSPAISAAGLEPHRADDLFRPSTIVNDIWAYTKKAKVLVADLTGKNANVFYELGLAHALAKPAILVAESMDDIPFDLRALRIILYDKNAPEWGPLLKVKIENALKEVLVAPVEAVLPAFLDVKSAGEKPAVSPERKDLIELKQELDLVRRQLRARSVDMEKSDAPISPSAARFRIRELVRRGAPERIIVDQLGSLGAPASWVLDQIRQFRKMKATRRHPPSSLAKRSKKS